MNEEPEEVLAPAMTSSKNVQITIFGAPHKYKVVCGMRPVEGTTFENMANDILFAFYQWSESEDPSGLRQHGWLKDPKLIAAFDLLFQVSDIEEAEPIRYMRVTSDQPVWHSEKRFKGVLSCRVSRRSVNRSIPLRQFSFETPCKEGHVAPTLIEDFRLRLSLETLCNFLAEIVRSEATA